MKFKDFLNEASQDFDFEEDDGNLMQGRRDAFIAKDDSKLKNSVKVFQTLKDQYDVQTARKILAAWKESGKENFKDFLSDLINTIKSN